MTWRKPVAVDNSGSVRLTSSHQSGEEFIVGETVVRYEARDSSNNIKRCSFKVLVEGKQYYI